MIVDNRRWHWVLVPMTNVEQPIESVLAAAYAQPPAEWIGVMEDAREEQTRYSEVRIHGSPVPRG
jgi:hypothetical protein